MISKTFEPIRPLRCSDDAAADYHNALGTGRTFYGESHWPSRSYSIWEDAGFCDRLDAREALRVHAGIRVS